MDASENPLQKPHFGRTYWTLNAIEMLERLAFYNLRVVAPIYIMQADNMGGLHLTPIDKGWIYAWWSAIQSGLPIVTGGLADRFGYKKTLAFAISLMILGYLMLAGLRDLPGVSNFCTFLVSILVLATGTAFFKPSIQGSLAHQMTKENSSLGWGIFYWVVNVGAFVGHFLTAFFPNVYLLISSVEPNAEALSKSAWQYLFLLSAGFTSLNFLLLFTLQDVPSGASKTESVFQVLVRTISNIFEFRLLCWMVIMSCFWLVMFQLWDLQPNFIADWLNSSPLADFLTRILPENVHKRLVAQTPLGPSVQQNVLLSFNSCFIILGVVGVAWLTRHMRALTAMFFGMILAMCGVLIAGWTQNVWILILGILFFSTGEMMTGPKKSEYLSLIAPPGKKGLYLGYVNIPVGVGTFFGSWMAGEIYGRYGEKAMLALRYLAEKTDWGIAKHWDGNFASIESTLGVKRSEAMQKLQEVTGMDPVAATQTLWNTYSPHYVWIPFAVIGFLAALALWIFGRCARNWKDMNA
jgi:proton-dependent oligopeptide transporter, POT family